MRTIKRPKNVKSGEAIPQAERSSPAAEKFSANFQKAILDDLMKECESALERAFNLRRASFVSAIAETLQQAQIKHSPQAKLNADGTEQQWLSIESLSALRHVVGGRFNNLKQKWVEAGFPLREHRGDKGKSFEIDQKGWIELSNWILKQGFESRLTPERDDCLFELKATK